MVAALLVDHHETARRSDAGTRQRTPGARGAISAPFVQIESSKLRFLLSPWRSQRTPSATNALSRRGPNLMDTCRCATSGKGWELSFLAEPSKVAALRRLVRMHLTLWGLLHLIDPAQLCVSELVANVIAHVGSGTPTTLAVSINGTNLRVEVGDPDGRTLPTLLTVGSDAEAGRGMSLINAVTDRWGVIPTVSGKTTWCELATGRAAANGRVGDRHMAKAEALLTLYVEFPR
ncbi:ATP-binding protein [Streptomyces sp. NPDC004647]|uniref:ATP-binding protein n=1 Tax=Streptomyces sp. NPDC004647 TaxID=3154671 RepID=UPI0033A2E3FD